MFTGIVQGKAKISRLTRHSEDEFLSLEVSFPEHALNGVGKGASIALNGTCLTVTSFDLSLQTATFDVIRETLEKTNLDRLTENEYVNFERAAKIGDEIGGHQMSGHIWATTEITDIVVSEANTEIRFATPDNTKEYVLEKGYIGLNGCSLTLANVTDGGFSVCLIPETLEVTTFGQAKIGDLINMEIDPQTQTIVETVKRILKNKS